MAKFKLLSYLLLLSGGYLFFDGFLSIALSLINSNLCFSSITGQIVRIIRIIIGIFLILISFNVKWR